MASVVMWALTSTTTASDCHAAPVASRPVAMCDVGAFEMQA